MGVSPYLQITLGEISPLADSLIDGVVAHEDSSKTSLLHSCHTLSTSCTHPVLTLGTPQAEHMFAWDLKEESW